MALAWVITSRAAEASPPWPTYFPHDSFNIRFLPDGISPDSPSQNADISMHSCISKLSR